MQFNHASLSSTLERLASRLSQLVPVLQEAASQASRGEVPSIAVSKALGEVHLDLAELEEALPPSDLPPTIHNLKSRIGQIKMGSVREILNDLLAVRHREQDEYPPLVPVHALVQKVLAEFSVNSLSKSDLDALDEGIHPLALFHRALSQSSSLTDHEWDLLAETFGEGLAFSITRGRLFIMSEEERRVRGPQRTVAISVQTEITEVKAVGDPTSAVGDQTNAVSDQDEAVGDQTNAVSDQDKAVGEQDYAVSDQTKAVGEQDYAVSDQTKAVGDPDKAVSDPDKAVSDPDKAVSDPDKAVSDQSKAVSDQNKAVSDQNKAVSDQNKAIGDQDKTVTDQNKVVGDQEKTVTGQDKDITGLEKVAFVSPVLSYSVQDLANLAANDVSATEFLSSLVWTLLERGDAAVAHLLARCVDNANPFVPTPALLKALTVGRSLRFSDGSLAKLLRDSCDELSQVGGIAEETASQAQKLLLVSAMLRPALLAPETGAADLLHDIVLRDGLPALAKVIEAVANYGKFGVPLDPSALQELQDAAKWQARADALSQQALEFRQRAPNLVIGYQPAQAVLMRWLESDSLLGPLLNAIQRNNSDQIDFVKNTLSTWKSDTALRHEVEHTDRKVIGRRPGKDIHSVALTQLIQRAKEVMTLARQWVALYEERAVGPTYARQQAFSLRGAVDEYHQIAVAELDAYAQQAPSVVAVAARIATVALQDVADLFKPSTSSLTIEPEGRHLLYSALLQIPGIELDEEWQPLGDPQQYLLPMLNQLAAGEPNWEEVLDAHLHNRDHLAAGRLLDWLAIKEVPSIASLRTNQENHLLECRDALRRHLGQTQTLIESSVALGLLREHERAEMTARVSAIEVESPRILQFQSSHVALDSIAQFLSERRDAEANAVRRRLEASDVISDSARSRINAALSSGDVLTANEYLDMVQNGVDSLPEAGLTESQFSDFWPTRSVQLGETLDKMPVRSLIRAISDQQSVPGLNMSMVPGAQARTAGDLLETWFAVKANTRASEASLQRIFKQFGFEVQSVTASKPGRQFEVICQPLRSKDQCPVAYFGSGAAGRYRVLCVFDRPTEEDLLNAVRETNQGTPCIVLHFGRITEKRRRDLARLSRDRRRTFLVVDDTLVLYLCSIRGSRLPVLFACTLPFTFLEPYSSRAGLVPPEMFYGRTRERDSLVDPNGSCFIYGGRQLGKTALLRDVANTFHQPDEEQVAVYVDLKVEGIGFDRPVDEVWHLLSSELKKVQVLGPNISPHADATRVINGIATWLEGGPRRRLLLLLDEADRFLELDGQDEYRRSERIKGLMDRSGRRFKAVFAGLHNVQRSTRRANHPLAHLGSAECIGPLLDDGQWREARALIERPLGALGYVFESSDLVTRILSQTNYYPSLIQLYIQQLLRHMQTAQPAAADPRTPPVLITARHVEEAYRSGELRKAIRDRFMWTLQLDERYELIAFALAYEIRSARAEDVLVQGLSVSAIRDEALRWWPAGFGDGAPEDSFRVLLEEMAGLGVLRMTSTGGYTLRSPNVVLLMGTLEEIEAQLLRPREAPLEYAQDSFRAAFRNKGVTDPVRRSPLTALQESILRQRSHGVTVVYGTEAAGRSTLGDYLQGVFDSEFFHDFSGVMDRVNFATRLETLKRAKDGVTLVYVPSECPWAEVWLQEAIEYVETRRSRTSFVRFVFAADPFQTIDMVRSYPEGLPSPCTSLSLRPWNDHALRQWMDENSMLPNEQQLRDRIWQSTGGWATLLPQIVRGTKGSTHRWQQSLEKVEADLQKSSILKLLSKQFGLDRRPFRSVLSLVAQFPESSAGDISALLDGMNDELVVTTLHSAEHLHLARRTSTDTWVVDNPLVLRILQEVSE